MYDWLPAANQSANVVFFFIFAKISEKNREGTKIKKAYEYLYKLYAVCGRRKS